MMKEFVQRLITENHQLQARLRWEQDDLVIWDKPSCLPRKLLGYVLKLLL